MIVGTRFPAKLGIEESDRFFLSQPPRQVECGPSEWEPPARPFRPLDGRIEVVRVVAAGNADQRFLIAAPTDSVATGVPHSTEHRHDIRQ